MQTDSEKLRLLADWFTSTVVQEKHKEWSNSTEVQRDLRLIADKLNKIKELVGPVKSALQNEEWARSDCVVDLIAEIEGYSIK